MNDNENQSEDNKTNCKCDNGYTQFNISNDINNLKKKISTMNSQINLINNEIEKELKPIIYNNKKIVKELVDGHDKYQNDMKNFK